MPRDGEIHRLLDRSHIVVILVRGVIAQNVHVEPGAFLDHRQTNSPGTDDGNRLAGNFVAEKRQEWMPIVPLVFPRQMLRGPQLSRQRAQHEECKLRRRFGEHICRIGKRNFVAIGVGAVDVVKADRNCATTFSVPLPASNTSASMESRSVVINPSIPDFTFSTINSSAEIPDSHILRRRNRVCGAIQSTRQYRT